MFSCLNESTIIYLGDSLSRQMYLSLNGMLFEMDGAGNNSLGNNGDVVTNDAVAGSTSDWIPHRHDFHNAPLLSQFHRRGGSEVVHTRWQHSNYWADLTVTEANTFYLKPHTSPFFLTYICELSKKNDIIVLAMAHWWTMIAHWNKQFFVNFTEYPHLRLKDHEVESKEQMLTVYNAVVRTTVNHVAAHFKGTVVWRTSSSGQYNNEKPERDCKNAHSSTEDAYFHDNTGEMNNILRKHVKPLQHTHKNHVLLDVADLSLRRTDALAGALTDCTHWCLPGIPDLWNMIMLNSVCGSVDE